MAVDHPQRLPSLKASLKGKLKQRGQETKHTTSASLISLTYENPIPLEQHWFPSLPPLSTPSTGISEQKTQQKMMEVEKRKRGVCWGAGVCVCVCAYATSRHR